MGWNPGLPWQVLVDSPRQEKPRRVACFAGEAEARAEALRLNLAGGYDPARPLYFVERWETSDVLDTEHSGSKGRGWRR